MKKIIINMISLIALSVVADINIIPQPNKVVEKPGRLALSSECILSGSLKDSPRVKADVANLFAVIPKETAAKPVKLQIDIGGQGASESYILKVSKDGVHVESPSPSGGFYALQTLKQLVLFSQDGTIPCLEIEDAPRFGWRGFMLDESRHFFGMDKVKELLDYMAMYKMNRFHWHLTDSPGWRIEIKKYPKLTTIGAIGNKSDPDAPAAFYTQEDIKEIVDYASQRFIAVIPEIDMPGHAAAAARAYPEISGGGSEKHPDFTFNPGSEKTYQFLSDVLTEVAALFPAKWIHYGGDEVHFANKQWLEMSEVKALMKKENLKDLKEVEFYFNRRMAKVIDGLGRKTVGWDEVVNAGLDKDKTLVMWWRHNMSDALQTAFDKGFEVVLCPRIPCYFDFVQDDSHKVGRRWKGFCSLDLTYKFPAGLNIKEKQVAGMQANLWSEKVATSDRVDFMTYPRLQALSEAAWTQGKNKNYDQFLTRLKTHIPYMREQGTYYFNPFDKTEHAEPAR
ncbi:MAG: beta-N-acetylhexosaminidase [Kiritimatiellae bacterium]|jgi:hexosaminidase|nr:beta-N-acetylhexosaminidase [Kiritimatiellia bacterium]